MKGNSKRRNDIVFIGFSFLLGFLMGWLEKDLAAVSSIGPILNNLGIWIFAGSVIAVFGLSSINSALSVFALFLAKLVAGYAHLTLLKETVSVRYLIVWICIAAVGLALGFIVYHSRDKEWVGAICASVPISILVAEGYKFYEGWPIPLIFDIVCAIALYLLLARGKNRKLMAIPFIIVFAFLIVYFGLLGRVFGGL